MRIFGLTVTHNEEHRYLKQMLCHAHDVVDNMFVYDDRSTDATVELCRQAGATTVVREHDSPSFAENEGLFRREAWLAFRKEMHVTEEDWVFALDADEFPVNRERWGHPRSITMEVQAAMETGAEVVYVPFKEMWSEDQQYRTDGYWDTICHPRLFAFKPADAWNNQVLGGGSWPDYVMTVPRFTATQNVILHYGYATTEDRVAKYERYNTKAGAHSSKHIQSILAKPTLAPWTGGVPLWNPLVSS